MSSLLAKQHEGSTGSDPPPGWTPVALVRAGMFAGRWMSFWLEVAQEPVHGRRKTEKDRRPLAPSPIVRLWVREYAAGGNGPGMPVDPTDIEVSHLVCVADLRPPSADVQTPRSDRSRPLRDSPPSPSARRRTPSPSRRSNEASSSARSPESDSVRLHSRSSKDDGYDPRGADRKVPTPRSETHTDEGDSSGEETATPTAPSASRPTSRGSDKSKAGGRARRQISGRNLYGNLHVAGVRVAALEGGLGLWFLFTDLCIRNEGSYSLRFRCFDMRAIAPDSGPMPALVHGQSADFKVYSPRNFPGLPKPTELADHFARQGYKLNTRKNERQAASPGQSPPPSATTSTAGKDAARQSHPDNHYR
ncbi:uncharacterized protein EHS24_001601 [Apiotrichum porosum]|uniref:Velvet domain-containing protein n=1 Tax=Apiotrichum porosum TaxID=105984 RepID=A0A427XIJ1_9TREE|nr:uncharacterized protein EHS24_001601 [Apiotrichum porosum]RSH78705.1 hypothetical protein EHS24_001601 [Apiotrichum porosum]